MTEPIEVIGAGLAGSEAALAIAKHGIPVILREMKPKLTPAHHSEKFGELVCSNSLRAAGLANGPGMLKEELRLMGSVVMEAADLTRVPAGGALAVDREGFSQYITDKIKNNPLITVVSEEVTEINPEKITVCASGPLTTPTLFEAIKKLLGEDYLYFFDAAAPIVTLESINTEKAFFASRYNKGDNDYINCPMSKEEYLAFYEALINAETVKLKEFEETEFKVFEGCMPVEEMARRGIDTLRFGNLKPVGIRNKDGSAPYAVVQLRQDNAAKTLFNLVGFQTHLTFGEQKRVFSMIPGLENAEFVRYGVMHRNTFINSPKALTATYSAKKYPNLFFAGQMTGVEGYIESASSGLLAGINAARLYLGREPLVLSGETATGALARYISSPNEDFQPMNINFGIVDSCNMKIKGRANRKEFVSKRGISIIENMMKEGLIF